MDNIEDKISEILNDPKSMEQVMSMAKALSNGNSGDVPVVPESSPMDADMLNSIASILKNLDSTGCDHKEALLTALEPYMEPNRIKKARHALKMLSLAKAAKAVFASGGDCSV